jgi:arylsulfatase A-like enzyme
MSRGVFILLFFIVPQIATAQSSNRSAGDKPNFVLIVADDLGFADLSMNGSKQIKTPHIDRLAQNGVNFTNGYVSSPVCSPSRAGFLTGRNQVRFGHDNNLAANQPGFDPQFRGLPLSEKTIADRLNDYGYINGLVGKWHLGYEPQFHPLKRGFDEFWGYTGGGHDYFKSLPDGTGYLSPIECNYKTPSPISYITDDVGNECADFIKRNKREPFFLFASFNAPHAPMQAIEEDLAIYDHIADTKRRTYAAMVHRLDVNVGKIIRAIHDAGIENNTIIAFISDNGGPVDSNASINAPYNGQKGILLEGGLHVPFILSWPGTIPANSEYHKSVSSLDFAPTIVELASGSGDQNDLFDGKNLIPFILGRVQGAPHTSLKWRFTISAAIREGDWKLIRLPDRLPLLFDLSADISEQHNLALENIEITRDLLKKIGDWDVSLPHPVFLEGSVWKRRQLDLYDVSYPLTQPE